MITTKAELKKYIAEDRKVNRHKSGFVSSIKASLYKSESYVICKYLLELRKCEYLLNRQGVLNRLLYKYHAIRKSRIGTEYKIQIPEGISGYGLRICHLSGGGGILLNANKIGNYCVINSGVILGQRHTRTDKPWIGDNVVFCPGSQAFGEVHIGDGAYICPNATITKDVPQNAIVAGVPANIIKYKEQ